MSRWTQGRAGARERVQDAQQNFPLRTASRPVSLDLPAVNLT
jgi:hypothetical protein